MTNVSVRYVIRKDGKYLRCRNPISWGPFETTPCFFEDSAKNLAREYQAEMVPVKLSVAEPMKEGNEK